jgi:CheY-like chemotaxis protein
MLTVFQIGEDRLLLETRRRVLESMGLTVVTLNSAEEMLDRSLQLRFDLAILCHTVPANRRKKNAATLRRANPAAPILLVGRGTAGRVADGDVAIDAIVDPDPERLTETLRRLLQLKQGTKPV